MSDIDTVDHHYAIDAIAGAQHLAVTTYDDGTVLVDGSMIPSAVPCSQAAWAVQVAADTARVTAWKNGVVANAAAYAVAHPERAEALAELIEGLPAPAGVT